MMITKKALPRRKFLRGVGVALGLPLLDAMVPALATARDVIAKPVKRMSFVYVPNGIMDLKGEWTPAAVGPLELTPILNPLESFRDKLLVVSGLSHNEAKALPTEGGGEHARACATWLIGVHPKQSEGNPDVGGISVDQIAAKELGKYTQLASLEVALDPSDVLGSCETGFSCAYDNTFSWRTPTTPNPMENNPRAVFENLFGDSDSTDPKVRLAQIRNNHSILDFVSDGLGDLMKGVGQGDRSKLSEYLDAIRDVERRIHLAEEQSSREMPVLGRPLGIPATFEEHAKLMFDMQALAFQADLTRVTSFMMGHELTNRPYPELGISDSHHPLTHHAGDAEKIAKVLRINILHTTTFAYFLEKLRRTPDGDGSLLDHSIIVYGGGLGDGNLHKHVHLPVLLAGGGSPLINGRHVRYPEDTPMPNLYLSLLDMAGVHVDNLGTSTGKLDLLSLQS